MSLNSKQTVLVWSVVPLGKRVIRRFVLACLSITMASTRRWVPYIILFAIITFGIANIDFQSFSSKTVPYSSQSINAVETIYGVEEVPVWHSQLLHRSTLPPLAGQRSAQRKFIAIGISTVYREENYLQKTLKSLVAHSEVEERNDAVVVIYLADTDMNKKEKQLRSIRKDFQQHLDSGFFMVIESKSDIYPPMDFALTKRTFNDSVDRVLWRAKQVIDFAFLFSYARHLASYYLVIEDDVITSNDYITAIKDFVTLTSRGSQRWVALQFSGFLGIGLLFRTSDLPKLINILLMFHQEQPVDMLMREFISLQVPGEKVVTRRIPSIFQHIGIKSTLPNKVQKLKDQTFDMAKRKFRNHNPTADLMTTMKVYNDFMPEYSYRVTPGFFWGIAKPHDTFDIVFQTRINISRIFVKSGVLMKQGKKEATKDQIQDGILEIGEKFVKAASDNSAICDNFRTAQTFINGEVNCNDYQSNVQCVRIKIGTAQKSWVIISEIEIFEDSTTKVEK